MMHRWSPDHPIPLHVSDGSLDSFMLIMDREPPYAKSSEGVSVERLQRSRDWALTFRLNNSRFQPMFQSLYDDICDRLYDVAPDDAGKIMVDVYNEWRNAFSTKSIGLSEKEIQGLIGEMVVIRDVLSSLYDPKTILDSWMLEDYGKQDFIFRDTWFEVKSILIGRESIHISSVEQLDCTNNDGFLEVVRLKRTSINDRNNITINSLIADLYILFSKGGCGSEFMFSMSQLNLPCDDYNRYSYGIISLDQYSVNDEFPYIKRSDLDAAVGCVEYELSLHSLVKYLV